MGPPTLSSGKPLHATPSSLAKNADELQQAMAFHQKGDLAQAAQLYSVILDRQPDHFDALHLLGLIALQKNDLLTGIELIGKAIQVNPDSYAAHLNRGNAFQSLKRYGEALSSYEHAIAIKADYYDAFNNCGAALESLGHYQGALDCYEQALRIKPDFVEALNNKGNALRLLNRQKEALEIYEQALTLKSDYVQALYNRGISLQDLKRFDESLASYDQALKIQPHFVDALNNRADVLQALKRHTEATEGYTQLLSIAPHYPYASGKRLHARLQSCDWHQHAQTTAHITQAVSRGELADTPSYFLAVSANAALQHQCARSYIVAKHPSAQVPLWSGERYEHERIRIAYLSADFHDHATAYLMAELFETHDKTRFDITAFSFGPNAPSTMRKRLERSFNVFIDVRDKSDLEIARMLRAHEIDIAIDLKGFTQGSRTGIFTHRAAPIQVNYLGYPGTMGPDYMDYILADSHVIPPGHDAFYAEKVVRLPDSYQVNDSMRAIAPITPTRAEVGLPHTGFVFCSFNNNYKITPKVFDIWMRLLQRVEGSVLWLLEDNPAASRNLRNEAELRGISQTRLVFAPRTGLDLHLARHRLADLFLDTLPVNAHTTASDSLWAGLPVLTCMDEAFASRVAASLLHAVGLPELVTCSLEEYEHLALKLALTPGQLSDIKSRLAKNRTTHALFNTHQFRQNLEAAYIKMHDRFKRGLAPCSFDIPPTACGL